MLIKSIVKKTLRLKAHKVDRVSELSDGSIKIELSAIKRRRLESSCCGKKSRVVDKIAARQWKHTRLWGREVLVVYKPSRVRCDDCNRLVVEDIPWSIGKTRLTTYLIMQIVMLAELLPWKQVAELFGVHWNTVRNAAQQAVSYGLEHRDIGTVLYIGVDEISRKKGHVYCTNVYDLSKKSLIWTGEGRDEKTMEKFIEEIGSTLKATVTGICCDMWRTYITSLTKCFPDATLVFDKFHIVNHLNQAIDQVRREEAHKLKSEGSDVLKGSRYIFLKRPENLTDKQRIRLSELVKLNLRINKAYMLKEFFNRFWSYTYRGCAKRFLDQWFWWATHSRIEPLRKFAWMLRKHEEGILNYFKMPISNGAVEGLNNKAKVIAHRAYGYRTFDTHKIALYLGMGKLPRPENVFRFL